MKQCLYRFILYILLDNLQACGRRPFQLQPQRHISQRFKEFITNSNAYHRNRSANSALSQTFKIMIMIFRFVGRHSIIKAWPPYLASAALISDRSIDRCGILIKQQKQKQRRVPNEAWRNANQTWYGVGHGKKSLRCGLRR